MPRDPRDISITGAQRTQRRLGEADDYRESVASKSTTGPAGEAGKSFRGNESLSITSEEGKAPGELVNRLTHASGLTATMKKLGAGVANQVITIQKVGTGTLTVKDGENLKIAGEFVMNEDDTLTLISTGTNWIEIARSNN